MSRLKRVAQWGTLGITIAALGAGAFAGRHYAEQRLLESMLGEGTSARSISVHWMRSTGCVDAFETQLADSRDRHQNSLSLYADKLWFVFDQPQLLRKRLVMPRVIAEGVLIAADTAAMIESDVLNVDFDLDMGISMPTVDVVDAASSDTSLGSMDAVADSSGTLQSQAMSTSLNPTQVATHGDQEQQQLNGSQAWIAKLVALRDELTSDGFAKSRQVAVDTDMLTERMQLHFENVRQQAVRALNEVRDIQLQIQSLDNVLRHELKIMAQRERIEQLKSSLVGLKGEVTRGDKALVEELSRVRAALLVEKDSLLASSKEFRAPPAVDLAREAMEQMIIEALHEPTRQALLMCDIMHKPFTTVAHARGSDLRYAAGQLPATDIQSAKLSGEMEWDGRRLPFTASGSFKIPSASSPMMPQPLLVLDTARWQMQIGAAPAVTDLRGSSQTIIDGKRLTTVTSIHLEDQAHWQATDYEISPRLVQGCGAAELRPWLVDKTESSTKALSPSGSAKVSDECVAQWMSYALSDVEEAPESLRFHFRVERVSAIDRTTSGNRALQPYDLDEAELTLSDEVVDWLGQRIANAATAEIADLTVAAAGGLEAHITQRIVELQRSVALMRKDADEHLNLQLEELRKIQAAINANLQQRAGTHFARLRSEEVVR